MSLTMGTGPFGHAPAGSFNFDTPERGAILLDVIPRRVRGLKDGETVVDSKRVHMLHESRILPVWYFPEEDVRMDLLRETGHTTHCPWKGDSRYYALGDVEKAAWTYPEPIAGMERLKGLVAFHFGALDEWLEEDEPVIGHPRDPFHRVDVNRSSRHVKVTLDGETLAESDRPLALFETGLPTRWYLPREDVRMDLLQPSETSTTCAYKGRASTFSSGERDDIAWTYAEPEREVEPIRGRIAFYNEFVDIELDGGARTGRRHAPTLLVSVDECSGDVLDLRI
jgi:uncharacterized protein (DUF427 family)